jgi:hypothetical protein
MLMNHKTTDLASGKHRKHARRVSQSEDELDDLRNYKLKSRIHKSEILIEN